MTERLSLSKFLLRILSLKILKQIVTDANVSAITYSFSLPIGIVLS